MKKLQVMLALLLTVCVGGVLAACNGPQTADTSAVAGTYYKHTGDTADGAKQPDNWIKLNADGTWVAGEDDEETSHSFTMDGDEISIYFGGSKMMYGTIDEDGKMSLTVFVIMGWEDAVFFKDEAPAASGSPSASTSAS